MRGNGLRGEMVRVAARREGGVVRRKKETAERKKESVGWWLGRENNEKGRLRVVKGASFEREEPRN